MYKGGKGEGGEVCAKSEYYLLCIWTLVDFVKNCLRGQENGEGPHALNE